MAEKIAYLILLLVLSLIALIFLGALILFLFMGSPHPKNQELEEKQRIERYQELDRVQLKTHYSLKD